MTQLSHITEGHITHPLVSHIYLIKGHGKGQGKGRQRHRQDNEKQDPLHKANSVLVIETQFPVGARDGQDFSTCLTALLNDLPELQRQAEAKIGRFDRVDIRNLH